MPGLKDACQNNDTHCCICGENECFISLSPRGDTILFVDGEEAITSGPRCDCIIALRRKEVNTVDIYSIELKMIRATRRGSTKEALRPDVLRQKCENCLHWALNIINSFQSIRRTPSSNINRYCTIVIPIKAYKTVATLIRRERRRYQPSISKELRILPCNSSITGPSLRTFHHTLTTKHH